MNDQLRGVIAAIASAVDENGEPDCARSTALARHLLDHGCDGLNVLGTTGEATSFSVAQRGRLMSAYRASGLPLSRMMVGTGAAATQASPRLAEIGHALYRVLFQASQPDGAPAHEVRGWLRDNLDGLAWLVPQLAGKPAGPRPTPRTVKKPAAAAPRPAAPGG